MQIRIFEKVVDEIIALLVVLATIGYVASGIQVPDWWSTAFGMVIAFYFTRKTVKENRESSGNSGGGSE